MNIISNFKFQLNKDRVIKMVQSYGKMPQYDELDKMYQNLLPVLKDHSNSLGIFKMGKKDESINLNILSKCKFTIYYLITLGEKCTDKINEMFEMVNNCVYPHKSLTYIYGADENISVNGDDHCCSRCSNVFCSMRRLEKENNYAVEKAIVCA